MARTAALESFTRLAQASAKALATPDSRRPNELRIIFDVDVGARVAAIRGGAEAEDLTDDWKPGDAGFDRQGWGMCLSDFADRLPDVNPAYRNYRHDPEFSRATLTKPLTDIRAYLVKKVKAVLI